MMAIFPVKIGERLIICSLLLAGALTSVQAQNAIALRPEALLGYSLDWLAPGGQATTIPSEISVYSLSCGTCVEELGEISSGFKPAPVRFKLTSFKAIDRALLIELLAMGLAYTDPKARRSAVLDVLRIYAKDPDHYIGNFQDWKTIVASHWPSNSDAENDSVSRAFATNVLDMQSRILALMDKQATPNAISLQTQPLAVETRRGTDRYNSLVASLALSWLRPKLDSPEETEEIPQRARSINPIKSLSRVEWQGLKEWALDGAYWIWGGTLSPDQLGAIVEWQAQLHLLPDDESRRSRHSEWFDQAIERAASGPLSPLEAFGVADIDALASPAWNAAKADARQQLVYASYLGALTKDE